MDLLPPSREWSPPYNYGKYKENDDTNIEENRRKKEENIKRKFSWARGTIEDILQKKERTILPIAVPEGEPAWNIEKLRAIIFDLLPKRNKVSYIRNLADSKIKFEICERIALSAIPKFSGVAAVIAATPIPLADILPLTALQIFLWEYIGYLFGYGFSLKEGVKIIFLASPLGFLFKNLSKQLLKFLPHGVLVNVPIATAVTQAYGYTAIEYYKNGKKMTKEQLNNFFINTLKSFLDKLPLKNIFI